MSTSVFARAEELFHRSLALDGPGRASFVREACGGDAQLREELEALLAGHARVAPDFLAPLDATLVAGRRVGEFTLVRLLGRGGMGAVYEALQDEPRRAVALKLVRTLPGLERGDRRLALEAAAMARLQHPHVAQVFAAGTLEDAGGRLAWFAMELIPEARDLTRHCRERALGPGQRLALFEDVCRAVQHGHQRGVVHCDLKPENLLVDAAGVVRVIDFGIARLLGREARAATLCAAPGDLRGTLAYMSPEQASGAAPDTRADVYSLGVVLYELLAGVRPLELDSLALPEALRAVRELEPPPPSRHARGLAPALDTIVLHALRKDPEARYASVAELLEDLRRAREHRPLHARPPGTRERTRLFVRRHRVLVAGALTIALTLAGAATVASVSGLRAVRAGRLEREARQAADRSAAAERRARLEADRVARLHRRIFESARPGRALGREVTVRELLDDALFHAERELAAEPAVLAELQATIGSTLVELGELERGAGVLAQALAHAADDPERVASLRSSLAYAAILRGEYARAEELLEAALALPDAGSVEARATRVLALHRQAELLLRLARTSEATAALEEASRTAAELPEGYDTLRARVLDQQGALAYAAREFAAAERAHRAALALEEHELAPLHPLRAATHNALASALFDQGKIDEAEEHWRAALEVFERVLDPGHPDLATVLGNLGLVHQRRRDFARAEELYARALALRRAALGDAHPRVAELLRRFADLELARGALDRARDYAEQALVVRQRAASGDGGRELELAQDRFALAMVLRQQGALAEACGELEEALRLQRATLAGGHPDLAQTLTLLGATRLDRGQADAAEPLLREALAIREAKLPGHWLTANTASVLGGCLLELGRDGEAAPLLEQSLPVLERTLGPDDFRTREARARLQAGR